MKILTTRELRQETRAFFDLAERGERVAVKRGKKYVNLVVTEEPDATFVSESWLKAFFLIPDAYRINPFETSPTGDLFYADRRNVEALQQQIERAHQQRDEGNAQAMNPGESLDDFLNRTEECTN